MKDIINGTTTNLASHPKTPQTDEGSSPPASNDEKIPLGLLDLPPEIRNAIYELSGCLRWYQCAACRRTVSGELLSTSYTNPDNRMCGEGGEVCHHAWRIHGRAVPGCTPCKEWHPANLFLNDFWSKPLPEPEWYAIFRKWQHTVWWFLDMPLEHAKDTVRVSQPALTKVCKQIREETLPIFYGSHRFILLLALYHYSEIIHYRVEPLLDFQMPAYVGLLRHLGIVYVAKRQLHLIRTVLLPNMREKGACLETMRLATTNLSGFHYKQCACIRCAIGRTESWGLLKEQSIQSGSPTPHRRSLIS